MALQSLLAVAMGAGILLQGNALRNGLDLVPPMGWSNWENSGCNVNETYVKATVSCSLHWLLTSDCARCNAHQELESQ